MSEKEQIEDLKRKLSEAHLANFKAEEAHLKTRARLLEELDTLRATLRVERDRADLICYKVRDLIQARAYNEAAAYCTQNLAR